MNVLFDITHLGFALYFSPAKGIARVVESLACGLSKESKNQLTFCTSGSSTNLYRVLEYLHDSPHLSDVPLAHNSRAIDGTLYELQKELQKQVHHPDTSTSYKALCRSLRKALGGLNHLSNASYTSLPPSNLKEADIYHSPYEAIPNKVKQTRGLSVFLTVHDLIPITQPQFCSSKAKIALEKIIASLDGDSWVFCISEATKADLCNYAPNLDPARVSIAYNAASNLFRPCTDSTRLKTVLQRYGIPEQPYILSLSTLDARKNIVHLIRSFAQLVQQEHLNDLNLVLVGAKGTRSEALFAELPQHARLRDRIILTGFVADADLFAIYSGALVFVYPSLCEGFGLPPLEAMQCGVPVITSNTSSLPEVVGDAGILLAPTDKDGLCQNLLRVYRDSSLREEMSRKSLKRAGKFTWDRTIQKTIQTYRAALSA